MAEDAGKGVGQETIAQGIGGTSWRELNAASVFVLQAQKHVKIWS